MADMTCLAEGLVVPADFEKTGRNLNEIVVGPTGCGKSFSNAYSRMLHTTDSSVVIQFTKPEIRDGFTNYYKDQGYDVINLDLVDPGNCRTGYDPLDFVHSDMDVIHLARRLVGSVPSSSRTGSIDPYWNDSATSVLAAEIGLVRLNAEDNGKTASFADVIKLHRSLVVDSKLKVISTNLDCWFERAAKKHPGNQASELWKTVQGLAVSTASCIISIVNNAVDKLFSDDVIGILSQKKRISFKDMGKQKTALFIFTSSMNKTLQNLINLIYSDMLKELFEAAQSNSRGKLDVPVHIICDDFACGSKIMDFEEYISVFRAAGISVTLLLQSESQLESMYGENEATTIINNCDTYVYMGGMDIKTCKNISQRLDKPLKKVLSMPLEQVVVFRRGEEPFVSRRYQILKDPLYQVLMAKKSDEDDNTYR